MITTNITTAGAGAAQTKARRNRRRNPVRFVSSRLGYFDVSRETKHEQITDEEHGVVAAAMADLRDRQ